MKFGMMSLDFKRLPLERCFRLARDYGFEGIEVFGSRLHLYPYDLDQLSTERILRWKREYGVEIPMYTPQILGLPLCICSRLPAERADGVALVKKAIDAASQVECPRVLITADHPGYFLSRETVWGYLVDSVRALAWHAKERGVKLVIEPVTPMESPVVTTADDCAKLIRDVNEPSLYAMLDVVPPVVVHEPISQYFELLGDRLDYVHICNTDGVTDAHLRLGEGVLPIADVLNVLRYHDYQGYVTAELYSENYRDPELMLSNTARILAAITTELGLERR